MSNATGPRLLRQLVAHACRRRQEAERPGARCHGRVVSVLEGGSVQLQKQRMIPLYPILRPSPARACVLCIYLLFFLSLSRTVCFGVCVCVCVCVRYDVAPATRALSRAVSAHVKGLFTPPQ